VEYALSPGAPVGADRRALLGAPRHRARRATAIRHRGGGTIRMYGFGAVQPPGNFSLASASETAGTMITSSPCFQLTGGATRCCAVGWPLGGLHGEVGSFAVDSQRHESPPARESLARSRHGLDALPPSCADGVSNRAVTGWAARSEGLLGSCERDCSPPGRALLG
jgi:hypothetical protein